MCVATTRAIDLVRQVAFEEDWRCQGWLKTFGIRNGRRHSSSSLLNPDLFLRQIPPLELLQPQRCLVVSPADGVGVHVCRYVDRRVSQPFGNSRDLHPRRQQVRPMTMAQRVLLTPFGSFSRLHSADTDAEIESGFKGVPSGFAKIKSKSVR
jgi:hypothetical protein